MKATNVRASPASDALGVDSYRVTNKQGSSHLRFGSWNIGTMTGKSRELADTMRRRRIDIACVQETRWKGDKARLIGDGYKLYFNGTETNRNGVEIHISEQLQSSVMNVLRITGRLMAMTLCLENGKKLMIVSAYAPQSACTDDEKNNFRRDLEDLLMATDKDVTTLIGADFNGHIGMNRNGYERYHGGNRYGIMNAEEKRNSRWQRLPSYRK